MAMVSVAVDASTALALVDPDPDRRGWHSGSRRWGRPDRREEARSPAGPCSPPVTGAATVEGDGASRSGRRRGERGRSRVGRRVVGVGELQGGHDVAVGRRARLRRQRCHVAVDEPGVGLGL